MPPERAFTDSPPRTMRRVSARALGIALALAAVLTALLAATAGDFPTTAAEVLDALRGRLLGEAERLARLDPALAYVVVDVRLPRIAVSFCVGATLAVAGVLMQGVLLNPLAEPYTLGVSAGAALGASLAIVLEVTSLGIHGTAVFAFLGAVLALLGVLALATRNGRIAPVALILAGVIVAAILSAGIGLLKFLADEKVGLIIFWLMGSFAQADASAALIAAVALVAAVAVGVALARSLDLLSLGERAAASLGVEVGRVRATVLLVASITAGACVAVSGIIAFVGLIVPHLLRLLLGPGHGRLVPLAALGGGVLLLAADTVTRAVLPHEVPIGVLTSLLGGPFFCVVFRTRLLGSAAGREG